MKRIRALSRGLTVVNALSNAGRPLRLIDIHQATGFDRTTLLRILATLKDEGWVFRGMGDNRYRLAYKIHDIADHITLYDAIAQVAAPVLDDLQRSLGWPSDLSVFDGDGMTIVETSRMRSPFVMSREVVGYRPIMMKSAMGRTYLAYCDERRRHEVLRRLRSKGGEDARLASDPDYVEWVIAEVRRQGYAVRDPSIWVWPAGEEEALCAIAVPVIVMEDVQASLSLVWRQDELGGPDLANDFYHYLKPAAERLAGIFYDNALY